MFVYTLTVENASIYSIISHWNVWIHAQLVYFATFRGNYLTFQKDIIKNRIDRLEKIEYVYFGRKKKEINSIATEMRTKFLFFFFYIWVYFHVTLWICRWNCVLFIYYFLIFFSLYFYVSVHSVFGCVHFFLYFEQ